MCKWDDNSSGKSAELITRETGFESPASHHLEEI
jgi:hypothetical protein